VEQHTVSQDQAAAYTAALDVLAKLIGYAANRIGEEQTKQSPDAVRIEHWRSRRDEWASRRRDLNPRDTAAVREVLASDAGVLRRVLKGGEA
jgi:hypothetical protein